MPYSIILSALFWAFWSLASSLACADQQTIHQMWASIGLEICRLALRMSRRDTVWSLRVWKSFGYSLLHSYICLCLIYSAISLHLPSPLWDASDLRTVASKYRMRQITEFTEYLECHTWGAMKIVFRLYMKTDWVIDFTPAITIFMTNSICWQFITWSCMKLGKV